MELCPQKVTKRSGKKKEKVTTEAFHTSKTEHKREKTNPQKHNDIHEERCLGSEKTQRINFTVPLLIG